MNRILTAVSFTAAAAIVCVWAVRYTRQRAARTIRGNFDRYFAEQQQGRANGSHEESR